MKSNNAQCFNATMFKTYIVSQRLLPKILPEVEYVNKLSQEMRYKIVANMQEVATYTGKYIWYFSLPDRGGRYYRHFYNFW